MAKMVWYTDATAHKMYGDAVASLAKIGAVVRDHIRVALSTPNSRTISTLKKGILRKKVIERGNHPSAPGDYPRKLTGHLRRNVQYEVDAGKLVCRVGTNVLYGKYLELGTKNGKLRRRPWLTRGFMETRAAIEALFRKKE